MGDERPEDKEYPDLDQNYHVEDKGDRWQGRHSLEKVIYWYPLSPLKEIIIKEESKRKCNDSIFALDKSYPKKEDIIQMWLCRPCYQKYLNQESSHTSFYSHGTCLISAVSRLFFRPDRFRVNDLTIHYKDSFSFLFFFSSYSCYKNFSSKKI